MESTSLVAMPGSRLPEMLGNFLLDNHHVEEWSDPAAEPGLKHRARKEVGKWVNLEKNADIHYQKQEDSKQSDRSQEKSRTEVIQGSAPDASFQVVRSHRQYQDGDENSGSKMQQTSSTSYHVSSSRGVRSTTKTTSNKTTTKTVTVSGGRADDFENLRMSFTPLDTSTQRERISVSRSGTMGIRRPPTRRHTPAALICSSPEDGPEDQRPEDGQILVDSDDNLRDTPDPGKLSEQSGISIVGFKNISPKIRVGFPVEIQLELQTKLRSSSTLEIDHKMDGNLTDSAEMDYEHGNEKTLMIDEGTSQRPEPATLPIPLLGLSSVGITDSNFDLRDRRKSFLSENFDSNPKEGSNQNGSLFSNNVRSGLRRTSLHQFSNSTSNISNITSNFRKNQQRNSVASFLNQSSGNVDRSSGISWDLIQSMRQNNDKSNDDTNKVYSTLSSGTSSGDEYAQSHSKFIDDVGYDSNANSQPDSFTHRLRNVSTSSGKDTSKKTIVTLNASQESYNYERKTNTNNYDEDSSRNSFEIPINHDSLDKPYVEIVELEDDTAQEKNKSSFETTSEFQYEHHHEYQDGHVTSTPDVLHHEISSANSLSPSLERSRKLLKMLDETPDLLNKMSFRSYFSNPEKPDTKDWEEEKDEMDWETQRQLSFLNDSLSRILEESRSIDCVTGSSVMKNGEQENSHDIGGSIITALKNSAGNGSLWRKVVQGDNEFDYNGNFKEVSKVSQVSQTWICSVDHKPSQTVRDNDVVTSISATNDAYKKGPKKVEFCKTEVHFTPDSGRFNIVETDENKPSTAHLFRRKKRSERKSSSQQQQQQQTTTSSSTSTAALPYSSSSSMSSLDSNADKNESTYIMEMQVNSGNIGKKHSEKNETQNGESVTKVVKSQRMEEKKTSTIQIGKSDTFESQWEPHEEQEHNQKLNGIKGSAPTSPSKYSDKSMENYGDFIDENNDRSHRVFINLENVTNHIDDYEDEIVTSPSQNILPNYGEMKIQRYLKQLKSNSRESSSSPLGSPTPNENDEDEHFRFDNILYENGSFVPLATRRSLIEMNNRNRKRQNGVASHSSDNSSTTSTYSLPTSDKDQYGTLRLNTLEATVSTSGSHPQITAVEFHYINDNNNRSQSQHSSTTQHHQSEEEKSEMEYHNLSVKERRERFSSVPSPVMPLHHNLYSNGLLANSRNSTTRSMAMSPTESVTSDIPTRPTSSAFMSKKPPTPILPIQFSAFEKAGAELRERFYSKTTTGSSKNNNSCVCINSDNEMSESAIKPSVRATSQNLREDGKLSAKSIVNIGGSSYDYDESSEHMMSDTMKSQEMTVMTTATINTSENDPISPEPVLSLDHTWKGPAHFEGQQDSASSTTSSTEKKPVSTSRSLTLPKSARNAEPEWVSKAKSRETRVTDWSLIEKQQQSTTTRNTEPPWISEIRFRNKAPQNEELKSLPKISVVYPWQRDSISSKEPSEERTLEPTPPPEEESHIVSIIPEPPMSSTLQKEEGNKRYGSHDLYSGKPLPVIKSLKSVPEVALPSRKSNKSVVEVHSEPEHYISSPSKYHQTKKETTESRKGATLSKSEKKSSSMRIITEAVEQESRNSRDSVISRNSNKRDSETLSKKSTRKPLQVTQKETSNGTTSRESRRREKEALMMESEDKYRTQPKPPKPPQRCTSLSKEESNKNHHHYHHHNNHSSSGCESTALMAIPPYRDSQTPSYRDSQTPSSNRQHRDKMSGTTSSISHVTTGSRRTPRGRKSDLEESPVTSRDNTPVHHRHPTIQISKLPMRTAKVSVVDGKRVSSGGSKSKPKHHAAVPASKGEGTKTKSESRQEKSLPLHPEETTKQTSQDSRSKTVKIRSSSGSSALKSSTRPPSSELELKKRKTTTTSATREKSKR